jgi:DNA end-binding protein Ku
MPRASWNGHLRLSLVSCPIYLTPATSESERIRLNMINPDTGNRVSMRTVDSETGEEVPRNKTIKGYEIEKGQYVTVEPEELESIQVESTKILELSSFIDRATVDPVYIDRPYFIYPDKGGEEAYRVITEALGKKEQAALGRIVLSSREHPVMVDSFEGGMKMVLLHAADEVRSAAFDFKDDKLNPEMIELAEQIMDKFVGKWEPDKFRDQFQEKLQGLIEAKQKGRPISKGTPPPPPTNVVDLMSVLRTSVAANDRGPAEVATAKPKRARKQDRRQGNILLPVEGRKPPEATEKKPRRTAKRGKRQAS